MSEFLAPILGPKVFCPTPLALLFLCARGRVLPSPEHPLPCSLDLSHALAVVHHMLRSVTSHHGDRLLLEAGMPALPL